MKEKGKKVTININLTEEERAILKKHCSEVVKLKLGPWAKHLMFKEVQEHENKQREI